jgi:hypothetical protein
MSKFVQATKRCPACDTPAEWRVAIGINVSRHPPHRAAILAGTFQRFRCPRCGDDYLVDDPFLYMDFERRQMIGVFPRAAEEQWPQLEREPLDAFERNLSSDEVSPFVRDMALGWLVRTVFGLGALREKLICFEAGIDDRALELLKLQLVLGASGLDPAAGLELVETSPDELVFQPRYEPSDRRIGVARSLLDAAALDPQRSATYGVFGDGPYVDIRRILKSAAATGASRDP